MTFSDRVRLSKRYKKWLKEKNEGCGDDGYMIADSPETLLAFLELNGLLREPHPLCCNMFSPETCESYNRESGFTYDTSDPCASCSYNYDVSIY